MYVAPRGVVAGAYLLHPEEQRVHAGRRRGGLGSRALKLGPVVAETVEAHFADLPGVGVGVEEPACEENEGGTRRHGVREAGSEEQEDRGYVGRKGQL